MVVHQLHRTLPGVPSACQMGHSVWAFWCDRCEFYGPKSVLKAAGVLYLCVYVCVCEGSIFFLVMHLCVCVSFSFFLVCRHVNVILNMKYSFYIATVWVTAASRKQKQIKEKKTVPYLITLNFQWHRGTWAIQREFFIPKPTQWRVCVLQRLRLLSSVCVTDTGSIDNASCNTFAYTVLERHERKCSRLWQPFIPVADIRSHHRNCDTIFFNLQRKLSVFLEKEHNVC